MILTGPTHKPLEITGYEKSSQTVYHNSVNDYLLHWTIEIDVEAREDIDAGRARLVVNLYDDSGRYDTWQIDDLGPISSGGEATYSLNFTIDEGYSGSNNYGEAILHLDGEQVDKVIMHFGD